MPAIAIHELTPSSLKLELAFNDKKLGCATGYIVKKDGKPYLVSNYHVLAGREPRTEKAIDRRGAIPNKVRIFHHNANGNLGDFIIIEEPLADDSERNLFITHSTNDNVDIAILPLTNTDGVKIYDVKHTDYGSVDIPVCPSQDIVIIGFPFGLTSNSAFPIWKTGHVASETDLPFQGLPCFLVDAATRGGMSGSPVFALIKSPYKDRDGNMKMTTGIPIRFMGTYSGRLLFPNGALDAMNDDEKKHIFDLGSDLGMVWNWELIDEMI